METPGKFEKAPGENEERLSPEIPEHTPESAKEQDLEQEPDFEGEEELEEVRKKIENLPSKETDAPEKPPSYPPPVAESIKPQGAFQKLQKDRLNVLVTNARHILGPEASDEDVKSLARRTFKEYARALKFSFNPLRSKEELMNMAEVVGQEHLTSALEKNGRAVVVTPHMAYFPTGMKMIPELLPKNTRGTTLVEKNALWPVVNLVQKIGKAFRGNNAEEKKLDMMVRKAENPATLFSVIKRLKKGSQDGQREVLFLAADRGDLSPDKMRTKVDFFDTQVDFPTGPATIARHTEAPIVPTYIVREGNTLKVTIGAPIELNPQKEQAVAAQEVTQKFADFFSQAIKEHPEQWPVYRHDYWPGQKDFKE